MGDEDVFQEELDKQKAQQEKKEKRLEQLLENKAAHAARYI